MPLPFIIAAAALAAAGVGVKKGIDAYDKNERSEGIVADANKRYENARKQTEQRHRKTKNCLESFGKFKVGIFTSEMQAMVDMVQQCGKKSSSEFEDRRSFTQEDLQELRTAVLNSLEISSGIVSGTAAGALTAMGSYGAVGVLASASTGTAIATLSGAAAKSATLAWLGGGSLAAGGFGMAGGMAVLGGLVAGPAIAVAGFWVDSKAEENLTKARQQSAEANKSIEQMRTIRSALQAIQDRVSELEAVITETRGRFHQVKAKLGSNYCEDNNFKTLMVIGKSLKNLLDIPILEEDGSAVSQVSLHSRIDRVIKIGNYS